MSDNILVGGVHLVLGGINGNVGDKQGVATIIVPVNVPNLVTAFQITADAVAEAMGISGLVCTDRPLSQDVDGEFTINFKFEGFNQQVTYEQAQSLVQVSFKPDKQDAPIQTHPKFNSVINPTYGPLVDGKFPPTYTPKNNGNTGFNNSGGKAVDNPFFGVEAWLKYGGTFSRTVACTHLPTDLWANVGILVDYPPDAELIGLPRFKKRKWQKESPEIDQNGSAFRITDNYRLTGQTNGAETIIYGASQLSDG